MTSPSSPAPKKATPAKKTTSSSAGADPSTDENTLYVFTIKDNKVVDTITLVDGEVQFDTGTAETLFESLKVGAPDDSDEAVFNNFRTFTNGYVRVSREKPVGKPQKIMADKFIWKEGDVQILSQGDTPSHLKAKKASDQFAKDASKAAPPSKTSPTKAARPELEEEA